MSPEEFRQLSVMERVEAVVGRLEAGVSPSAVKQELGLTRYELSHLKRLDKALLASTKQLISRNGLSEGHARTLARLSGSDQDKLVRDAIQKHLSVRSLEQAVNAHLAGKSSSHSLADTRYYQQLSDHISEQIGHPVTIKPASTTGQGQLVISYLGLDAFEGILKRMRVTLPDEL